MVRIGISGWRYVPWRGTFYPEGLTQDEELAFASRQLPTIEINGTFYGLQRPAVFASWYEQTPPGFVFSVKGPRFITHVRRLGDVEPALANFFAQGLLNLREKLGPFLWQFPPNLAFDADRFERFLDLLPRSTRALAALAAKHEPRMAGRTQLSVDEDRPIRHAVEIRHPSFRDARFVELLRAHHVALVVADTGGKWPELNELTSDFMYLRLHGSEKLYSSGYTEQALAIWKSRIQTWMTGGSPTELAPIAPTVVSTVPRDVYCYFDNDLKVRSPIDARRLMTMLGLQMAPQ